jgi:hypothetical protein
MSNQKHQWTIFQKGRLRIKACSCCGEMNLPSNNESICDKRNILTSPIVRAGYVLANDIADSEKSSKQVA